MELIVSISRAKGKVRVFFFVISQGAKVPLGTLATTMLEMVLNYLEQIDLLRFFSMTPFTEVNKPVNVLHIVPAKMHYVFSCITCFHPSSIKR